MSSLTKKAFTEVIEGLIAEAQSHSRWGTWNRSARLLAKLFTDTAEEYNHPLVTKEFLAAQAYAESMFSPDVVSAADARGISQFIPSTWDEWGRDLNADGEASPFVPKEAIDAQARYMIHIVDDIIVPKWGNELDEESVLLLAAAGYNAGPENARKLGQRLMHPVFGWREPRSYTARIKRLLGRFDAAGR